MEHRGGVTLTPRIEAATKISPIPSAGSSAPQKPVLTIAVISLTASTAFAARRAPAPLAIMTIRLPWRSPERAQSTGTGTGAMFAQCLRRPANSMGSAATKSNIAVLLEPFGRAHERRIHRTGCIPEFPLRLGNRHPHLLLRHTHGIEGRHR